MASASLVPYRNNTNTETFYLVSQGENGATYKVAGRELSLPYVVQITRKIGPGNNTANDHVVVRVARTERNASTGKLATAQVLLDISCPKDTSVLTLTVQKELVSVLASILNECTAMEATNAKITALVSGSDL